MRLNNEDILIKSLKNSDSSILKGLFERFYNQLCRFAFIMLQSYEAAEDVVQQTFIYLWENRMHLDIKNNLKSYLFVTVKNNSVNYLKSHKIRKQHEFQYMDNQNKYKKDTDINTEKFSEALKEALQKLPEQCRIIYTLKNLEGLTYKEIAEYLQISERTVENQISIALKKLREMLLQFREEYYSI